MVEPEMAARLAPLETELERIVSRMEGLRVAFEAEAAKTLVRWYREIARGAVEKASEVTSKLTDEQLREMKADTEALANASLQNLSEMFASEKAWWHQRRPLTMEPGDIYHPFQDSKIPDYDDLIGKPLRMTLGLMARTLDKYGYNSQKSRSEVYFDRSGGTGGGSERAKYRGNLSWPESLAALRESYRQLLAEAQKVMSAMHSLREANERASAAKRWDAL